MYLPKRQWRLTALIIIVAAGLAFAAWQPMTPAQLLALGEQATGNPLTLAALVVAQALLFTFALPGSMLLWALAPFQSPWLSVPLLVTGSVAGAVGARYVAWRLYGRRPLQAAPQDERPIIALLRQRADFMTQCAMRALPGFPHSIINYAGGTLALPLPTFVAAAIVGLTFKWGVYASAIYGAASAADDGSPLSPATLLPLAILAGALIAGGWLQRRIAAHRSKTRS